MAVIIVADKFDKYILQIYRLDNKQYKLKITDCNTLEELITRYFNHTSTIVECLIDNYYELWKLIPSELRVKLNLN